MKYIKQPTGEFSSYDETSESFKALNALPKDLKPEFLDTTDAGLVAYLAAQAEAAKLAEEKADEAESIAELTKELLGDKLTKRIAEKREAREKLKATRGKK